MSNLVKCSQGFRPVPDCRSKRQLGILGDRHNNAFRPQSAVNRTGCVGVGLCKIDITYTALNSAIKVVDEIKSRIVAAREPGVDRSKIQDEIISLQGQLQAIASSASFSGENWLSVDSGSANYTQVKSIVASFNRTAPGFKLKQST